MTASDTPLYNLALQKDDQMEEYVDKAIKEYYSLGRFADAACMDAGMFVGRMVRDEIFADLERRGIAAPRWI